MRVNVSAQAEADLHAIGEYISRDDPGRARSFVAEIERCLAELDFMPKRFQRLSAPEVDPSVHRLSHGRYRIYYAVSEADQLVEIITIRHLAQNLPDLLSRG